MRTWLVPPLMALALLTVACWRAAAAPIPSATQIATPEPIRPPTAEPLPRGQHTIYVVDPHNGELVSTIWIVDPDTQRVVGGIGARYTPEIAFTPDGARLYVADSYSSQVIRGEHHDVVSVYDAYTSALVHDDVEIHNRLLYKLFPDAPSFTFLSRDGKRLFVGKYGDPDIHALRMTVLDAHTFETLAEYPRPDCDLMPLESGELLCVANGEQPRLVSPLTGEIRDLSASLPASYRAAVLAPFADRLYLVYGDARSEANLAMLDLGSAPIVTLDSVRLSAPPDHDIGFNCAAVAPDGSRLYVGFAPKSGELAGRGLADEIWAYNAKSGTRVGVFKPIDPAFQIALSRDGTQLYTVNPFKKSLTIFDTATFREIGALHDLGDTPALVVVPPAG